MTSSSKSSSSFKLVLSLALVFVLFNGLLVNASTLTTTAATTAATAADSLAHATGPIGDIALNHIFRSKAHLTGRPYIQSKTRSHPETLHRLVIAIKQKNTDQLESILMEVSDPKSSKYGQHWTRTAIGEFTANPESSEKVLHFLQQHFQSLNEPIAVEKRSLFDEYIVVTGKVKVWEKLFHTHFFEFTHSDWHNEKIHRAFEYSLPMELDEHIESIGALVDFPTPMMGKPRVVKKLGEVKAFEQEQAKKKKSKGERTFTAASTAASADEVTTPMISEPSKIDLPLHTAPSTGRRLFDGSVYYDGYVTPTTLRETYSIFNGTGNSYVKQAIYSTNGQTVSLNDLSSFQYNMGVPVQTISTSYHGYVMNNGCKESIDSCTEANLDVQYMMSTGQNIPTITYYDGFSNWYDWLVEIASWEDSLIPDVISMSYGSYEIFYSQSFRTQFNLESMKLGIRGVSLLVSTGDDGITGWAVDTLAYCDYYAMFPAASPYWTAVGATMGPESGTTEVACSSDNGAAITTGGGFSHYSATPSWQTSFVSDYFTTVNDTSYEPVSGYNSSNRGYPDISALGSSYIVVYNASYYVVSGTSCSSPVVAGMVSLLNAARKREGKSTMGFLNPFLYASYNDFVIDITSGNNKCKASTSLCCTQGFYCSSGWDPVTGLGSLNFTLFYESALAASSTSSPTRSPTLTPTLGPGETYAPSKSPTRMPTKSPTLAPSAAPSRTPSKAPTRSPTKAPSRSPTVAPSRTPTAGPSVATSSPTRMPTYPPTLAPSIASTTAPSVASGPSQEPSYLPTMVPSGPPSLMPSKEPTVAPTKLPTAVPTMLPTRTPTVGPSAVPSQEPTLVPTKTPSDVPTKTPTIEPTLAPTRYPTFPPTCAPSRVPSASPTQLPTVTPSAVPSRTPTVGPSAVPSQEPTFTPTKTPSEAPTKVPTREPTYAPTRVPTEAPTKVPTKEPTFGPTRYPTFPPTCAPSRCPTASPTKLPTAGPTYVPTKLPTASPTKPPTKEPTCSPTKTPTLTPSAMPTKDPTLSPTKLPTVPPTCAPSQLPTISPTRYPTFPPTCAPTRLPTPAPSFSRTPTRPPTKTPTVAPSVVSAIKMMESKDRKLEVESELIDTSVSASNDNGKLSSFMSLSMSKSLSFSSLPLSFTIIALIAMITATIIGFAIVSMSSCCSNNKKTPTSSLSSSVTTI